MGDPEPQPKYRFSISIGYGDLDYLSPSIALFFHSFEFDLGLLDMKYRFALSIAWVICSPFTKAKYRFIFFVTWRLLVFWVFFCEHR